MCMMGYTSILSASSVRSSGVVSLRSSDIVEADFVVAWFVVMVVEIKGYQIGVSVARVAPFRVQSALHQSLPHTAPKPLCRVVPQERQAQRRPSRYTMQCIHLCRYLCFVRQF